MYKILIVDDELDICLLINGILKDENYESSMVHSVPAAIAEIDRIRPDLVLLDIWLGDKKHDGLQVLEYGKNKYPEISFIVMSGHGNIAMAVLAIKKGAYDFMEKPFEVERLLLSVQRALESQALKRENIGLKERVVKTPLIGKSVAFNKMMDQVKKTLSNNTRIMLYGPHGIGKESIARYIHENSCKANGNFIHVKCTHIKGNDIDDEIFKDLRSNTCTIYLEELLDLSHNAQNALLDFINKSHITHNKNTIDLRIISSSSVDPSILVANSFLKKDLFYRLNILSIAVPSLKERKEDVKLLAEYFLKKIAQHNTNPKSFDDEAIAIMEAYSWPGNIRQLKNVLEWITIMSEESTMITTKILPTELFKQEDSAPTWKPADFINMPLKVARDLFERAYLKMQLNRFGWNISVTADHVQMERSALHRKLKTLGISIDRKFL